MEKGLKMVSGIADSIAAKSKEIFRELDRIQGGVAEVRTMEKVR